MNINILDSSDLTVETVYVLHCQLCEAELRLSAEVGSARDAALMAGGHGWYGYETNDESCGCACAECISEVREGEAEFDACLALESAALREVLL